MRSLRLAVLLSLTGALALPATAQNPECSPYSSNSQTFNICNAAIDGTRLFHPVVGLLISGGNPVLASVGTLGGLPHFSVTARVNATSLKLPDPNYDGTSNTVPLQEEMVAPAPLVEGALGIWKGLPGGLLSVDLLASAQLLPTEQFEDLRLDPEATSIGGIGLGLGYGARVGVLAGRFPIPSVSVSVMRRSVPRITYGDITDPSQDYQYSVDLTATNVRAIASTRLAILTLGAGLGWDRYTGEASVDFRDAFGFAQPPISIDLAESRFMGFVNAGLDLAVIRIGAELGYQGAADQNLVTTFEGVEDGSGRLFGGLGVGVGF